MSELVYQIRLSKPKILIVHPVCLTVAQHAAKQCNLSADRIVLLTSGPEGEGSSFGLTLGELVSEGGSNKQHFVEKQLKAGEAKSKLAFLSFSSGTTGQAKVRTFILYLYHHSFSTMIGCRYFTLRGNSKCHTDGSSQQIM